MLEFDSHLSHEQDKGNMRVLTLYRCIFFLVSLCLHMVLSTSTDTITLNQSISDGDSLVSARGVFKLGFFSPGSDERRYVGIWYNNISAQTYVWVANREKPLHDSSGVLQINGSVLVLVNGTGTIFWSTNSSRSVHNPIAQLYDNGNFVVRDRNDENQNDFLWQSFDYPCDTQLPGMKLGKDFVTGFERALTSWKSSVDPSPGSYTYKFDLHGYPQPVLLKDSVEIYREGPWNGIWFSENSMGGVNVTEKPRFVYNDKEIYYVYDPVNSHDITIRVLYISGTLQRLKWDSRSQTWSLLYTKPINTCDNYEACGEFAICDLSESVPCRCMEGFVPKSRKDWDSGVWSDGCVRSVAFNCSTSDEFFKYSNVKLPDTRYSWYNSATSLRECRNKCLENCSCMAYANSDITNGGSGCLLWFNRLVDVEVSGETRQDLYVRIASSGSGKKHIWIAIISSVLASLLIGSVVVCILWRRQKLKTKEKQWYLEGVNEEEGNTYNSINREFELPIFAFNAIESATNFFSDANKLGEGGFGPVYKGTMSDGQEIAVKRLSSDSKQGLEQFKNEAMFIAKLQHRNLVKLLGCCTEADEQILIYEYMPNKSLDNFIFDKSTGALLDWPKRFKIIKGIARGLVYLHEDSRLRIVHRDLKASNILLDSEMNAKISDFGMARSFDGIQEEAKTRRVVGTYGYMPPEYTIDGLFSVKSDVFSFGVLVLEIVSATRNRGFKHADHYHNLLGHIYMLFKEGTTLEIVDPLIKESSIDEAYQMQRTIQVGLLCVQQHPEDRPSMSHVTVMLSTDSELPEPKEPGFFIERNLPQESHSTNTESVSNVDMTVTLLSGR